MPAPKNVACRSYGLPENAAQQPIWKAPMRAPNTNLTIEQRDAVNQPTGTAHGLPNAAYVSPEWAATEREDAAALLVLRLVPTASSSRSVSEMSENLNKTNGHLTEEKVTHGKFFSQIHTIILLVRRRKKARGRSCR